MNDLEFKRTGKIARGFREDERYERLRQMSAEERERNLERMGNEGRMSYGYWMGSREAAHDVEKETRR